MADDKQKQEGSGSLTQIIVTVITVLGTLGVGLFANWDKIHPSSSTAPSSSSTETPPGNYQITCPIRSVKGDILKATCKDQEGQFQESSLDFKPCQFGIENINGRLECRKP